MPLQLTCSILLLFSLGRYASTAPPPLPLSSLTIFNITAPFKHPSTTPISWNAHPPDPCERASDWDGPGFITVTFSHYGAGIRRDLARSCTSLAFEDAWSRRPSVWNHAIGESELVYANTQTSTHVLLGVLPRAAMTWNMFFYAALLLNAFVTHEVSMAFEFGVEVSGVQGLVATGNLSAVPHLGS